MLLLDEVCVCAQSCLTLCNPMDYSLPGSTAHGIFQAGKMKWVAISSSRGSSWPMDWTCVSCISCIEGWILYHWATWESPTCSQCFPLPCQPGYLAHQVSALSNHQARVGARREEGLSTCSGLARQCRQPKWTGSVGSRAGGQWRESRLRGGTQAPELWKRKQDGQWELPPGSPWATRGIWVTRFYMLSLA